MPLSISSARATLGLSCTATPVASEVSGSFQIGSGNQTLRLETATQFYALHAIFAGSGDDLALDLNANVVLSSTAWVAGTAQVETATAAGTITAAGNATITVTSTGMAGSPLAISVAVANTDTAATWAGKVRTALAANAVIAARFSISGATTAIVLTRKPISTYTVLDQTVNIFPATDSSLNVALANGTSTGITTALSSAHTTAGVATDGVKIFDGAGVDASGTVVSFGGIQAIKIALSGESMVMTGFDGSDSTTISRNEVMVRSTSSNSTLAIEPLQSFTASSPSLLAIAVVGGIDI